MRNDKELHRVRARSLAKSYGLVPVLRGIDLQVDQSECLAVLGANGAGKSTLLKILAGVARASQGEFQLFGVPCHPQSPPNRILRRIGFVGHEPLVYRDLTPRENLDFFARAYRIEQGSAQALARCVEDAIERVDLGRFASRDVRTLSRGTLQRLSLARATLHAPELLLLDEPFTGLDESGRNRFRASLEDLREAGTTIVMVSHDLDEVCHLATRAMILRAGRVAGEFSPIPPIADFRDRYRRLVEE